jgi:hydrogenase nickel incorporation protein HypA/HybF
MHEYSLACEIFENVMTIAQANSASGVKSITLKIGRLAHINPDQLLFSFETLAEGSIAGDAHVNVEFVPPSIECECGYRGTLDDISDETANTEASLCEYIARMNCPVCGGITKISGGRELIIQTIEVEQ